jgi:16S rRNA (guanine(966)-N(2))-methyltransferase RsmD
VRQALFNIIGGDISGASMLDLFAGTGSVGIEALSRGASRVVFVDVNRLPVQTVKENLRITGLEKGAEVHQIDAFRYLERLTGYSFDYVYIAPPQYKGLWKQALLAVDAIPDLFSEDAWVIVQIHPVELEELKDNEALSTLVEFERRQYGSTLLLFYERIQEKGNG